MAPGDFGGQATLYNFPWPSWSAGLFYEEGLYNWYNDKRHSGGRAFLRYRFLENSSFLVDDAGSGDRFGSLGCGSSSLLGGFRLGSRLGLRQNFIRIGRHINVTLLDMVLHSCGSTFYG